MCRSSIDFNLLIGYLILQTTPARHSSVDHFASRVMSVETAGLVLATLPIVVEIAKAYARGIDTLFNIALHSRRDKKLIDFYEEFFWSLSELDQNITRISHAATAGQSQPASLLDIGSWNEDSEIVACLKRAFQNEAAYDQYVVITDKIATLLAMLVANQSLYINKADMVRDYSNVF